MNKLEIATKAIGCIVAALIIAGMFNAQLLSTFIPFILVGTAATVGLYILNAFKTKNYGRMTAILILAAFIAVIVVYNNFM